MRGRPRKLNTEAIVAAYAARVPIAVIAERFGCALSYPGVAARRAGMERRRTSASPAKRAAAAVAEARGAIAPDAVEPPPKWADRESQRRARARAGRPTYGRLSDQKRAEMAQVQRDIPRALAAVPKWVPRDLRREYVDNAQLYGEEVAASIARRQKRAAEGVR